MASRPNQLGTREFESSGITMKRIRTLVLLGLAVAVPFGPLKAQAADRIWGTVTTSEGARLTGFIRWDRNELNWADLLNGSKRFDWEALAVWDEAIREGAEPADDRSIEFAGYRITWDDDLGFLPDLADSGIRFGHISVMRVTGNDEVELTLRSGQRFELSGGATDIGSNIREFLIEVPGAETVELDWDELDQSEFSAAPAGVRPTSPRLYGRVEDRWGNPLSGYIAWDLDEALGADLLNGEENGRSRAIAFEQIASIQRDGWDGSIVTLRDGTVVRLSDSSDVGRGHGGVQVSDPLLGQVTVSWDDFGRVDFTEPDPSLNWDDFQEPGRMRGTVETESGESVSGWIRWDADEEYGWEILNGNWRDLVHDVEFAMIARIEKRSSRESEVTLWDGRVLELDGSNDVDRGNKGVFVETDSGERYLIKWENFAFVEFERR